MKSIMEQASSIIKAIEKAWISADRPKEFSVKIFEKEEKNFFGMTTKQAKIGIFFPDKSNASQEKHTHKMQHEIKEQRFEHKTKQAAAPVVKQQPQPHSKPVRTEKPKIEVTATPVKQQRAPIVWTESMVDAATAWIKKIVTLSNIDIVHFTPEIAGKILKISFEKPLIENQLTEKQLFRSAAHLIMSSLRNQYKQQIRDLKIVLIRPE